MAEVSSGLEVSAKCRVMMLGNTPPYMQQTKAEGGGVALTDLPGWDTNNKSGVTCRALGEHFQLLGPSSVNLIDWLLTKTEATSCAVYLYRQLPGAILQGICRSLRDLPQPDGQVLSVIILSEQVNNSSC